MRSPSYGCFSAGMRDDRVITVTDWQEAPLGYSVPCSALSTAVNNHETLTRKSLRPG